MLLDNNTNIPQVDLKTLKELLINLYKKAVIKGIPLKDVPCIMLWGPPGAGKSSAIEQVCTELEHLTKKKVNLVDIRLALFSPVDLRGVPIPSKDHTNTVWLRPSIFDLSADDDTINLIFLDELSSASTQLQADAYQICLDHRIGEHKLPDNTIVIAAGNRTTDHAVAYKMPSALANRMLHFDVEPDIDAWRDWAIDDGVDKRILDFISFDNSKLNETPNNNSLAYPTPRSWGFVDTVLKITDMSVDEAQNYIAAAVGNDIAIGFNHWYDIHDELPTVEAIISGTATARPRSNECAYTIISSLTEYVSQHKDSITSTELDNAFRYCKIFPSDFTMMLHSNLVNIDGINLKLMKCQSVREWINKKGA